ncbi:MAG: MFS transporter [Pseudonocardia sp.]|nr:MFS transporter [Pseudonocardia sp.]
MLVGLMLGVSLAALDMTIVATSVRTIADDLGGLELQAWATTAYLISSAVTTPLYGRLSDVHGRKPLFLVAIGIFVLGSLACTFATSMYQLAIFRAVQGLGAGGLFSLSVTIIGDLVPPRERARWTGLLIAVYGVFGVLGPVVGGLLADTPAILGLTGWRWVFGLNVPVGLLAFAVVARVLAPGNRAAAGRRVDWAGAGVLALGVVPLLVVADEGRKWGWTSYPAVLCYLVGVAGLLAFVFVEQEMGEDALLPLRLLRNPTFRLGTVAGVVVGFGMFGVITALPLYLQIVGGASPTGAGLLMLPLVAGIVVTTAVSGRVIEATGRYRSWLVLGVGMMIVGLLWLSAMDADTPFVATAACMAVFGVGLGANLQSITLAVQNALPSSEVGVATASTTFARQLGGSAGAAVFLAILFGTVADRIEAAFRAAAGTPAFQDAVADPGVAAMPANAEVIKAMAGAGSGIGAVLEDSSFLATLHPELARPFLVGFSDALGVVFLAGAVVLVLGLGAVLAMPDDRLRHDGEIGEVG